MLNIEENCEIRHNSEENPNENRFFGENSNENYHKNQMNFHCKCKCHLMDSYVNCQCDCEEKLSKCSEIDKSDECENIDIISIIKFCDQNKQIVFPAQVDFIKKFEGFLDVFFEGFLKVFFDRFLSLFEIFLRFFLSLF